MKKIYKMLESHVSLWFLVVSFVFCTPLQAQLYSSEHLSAFMDFRDSLYKSSVLNRTTKGIGSLDKYLSLVNHLKEYLTSVKHQGKIDFSLNQNTGELNDISKISIGLGYQYGSFPSKINASAKVQSEFKNGALDENISDIDISFSHFVKQKSNSKLNQLDAFLEGLIYINRMSNSYLGIESRYEVGGGFTLHIHQSGFGEKGISEKGKITNAKVLALIGGNRVKGTTWGELKPQYDLIQPNFKELPKWEGSLERAINRIYEDVKLGNTVMESKRNVALGLGCYNETERISITDTLVNNGDMVKVETMTQPATNKWRTFIRPIIKWKVVEEIQLLGIFTYKFTPLQLEDQVTAVIDSIMYTSQKSDVILDVYGELKFDVTERFSSSVKYKYTFNHAPRRTYIKNEVDEVVLLQAQKEHQSIEIGFAYKL
jgi:hypothetical protein